MWGGVCGGMWRCGEEVWRGVGCGEECVEVCGGVGRRGVGCGEECVEVCGGVWRSGETEHTHQDIVEEEKLSAL